ncbi:MAG: hypothetical protein U0X73_16435 [Thermoanaerobaculia bacterium]
MSIAPAIRARTARLAAVAALASWTLLPLPAAASTAGQGRIYGTIETESGNKYTGLLRWGGEEAFWDDHFNASKEDRPALDARDRRSRHRNRDVEVFGIRISGDWSDDWAQRQFIARFGDLSEIRPQRHSEADLVMRNGETIHVEGGSNDLEDDVTVWDEKLGKLDVAWSKIRSIKFTSAPASLTPAERRLYGKVKTTSGEFEGFVQWDSEECLSTDKLDGETEDGDISIEMGNIRSIERRSRRGSWVSLVDGRRIDVSGTNDVDDDIRGILVEDPRYGRVKISWDAFERVDFVPTDKSGRGYDEYPPGKPIVATVTDAHGKTRRGEIAYDLDETGSWELLDGSSDDIDYSIPFEKVKSVRPLGGRAAEVVLRDGSKLRLEGETDVSDDNGGIGFLKGAAAGDYVAWEDVERIDFD